MGGSGRYEGACSGDHLNHKAAMISIDWNPIAHLGSIPINWYGLTYALGFLAGSVIVRRHAPRFGVTTIHVDEVLLWIALGSMLVARLYYVVQNDFSSYLHQPWRIVALWEGGLAFFGGLIGGIVAAWMYARQHGIPF